MQQVVDSKMSLTILVLFLVLSQSFGVQANEPKNDLDKTSLPASLYRFLLYTSKPQSSLIERQANLMGYKRSSGTLDALTGMTLGKRSDYALNLEPYFGRHYAMRQTPRLLALAPGDYYDADSY